jgi:hypothetical protein
MINNNIKKSKGKIIKLMFEKLKKFTINKFRVMLNKKIKELKILLINAPLSLFFLDKYEIYNKIIP